MTAVQPLYVREGSRFVLYDSVAQHVPPIPVPQPVDDERLLAGWTDPEQPNRTVLEVARCPHGSFEPWASRNCKECARAKTSARRRT